jgi:hypothetical protein
MTQPKFAPIQIEDQVRDAYKLKTPESWAPIRPADFRPGAAPAGRGFGTAGPDQGYALHLVRHIEDRVRLAPGELLDDAKAGCVAIAMRRAAVFGRAPVMADLEVAFTLAGYLDGAPADLVAWRKTAFAGVAHDRWAEVVLASGIPESTLRLTPAATGEKLASGWRELLGIAA